MIMDFITLQSCTGPRICLKADFVFMSLNINELYYYGNYSVTLLIINTKS